jgi:hypothetical protein
LIHWTQIINVITYCVYIVIYHLWKNLGLIPIVQSAPSVHHVWTVCCNCELICCEFVYTLLHVLFLNSFHRYELVATNIKHFNCQF